jgi:hypothetical protein
MGELRGTKRAHAVAAAERGATGALPLLGAPLLAVVATFVLQPKASGYDPDGPVGAEAPMLAVPSEPGLALQLAAVRPSDISSGGPWADVRAALDAKRFDVARSLLGEPARLEARAHWRAYSMMLECLERPSDEARTAARRFYLDGAPADVRADLFKICLSTR